MTIGIDASRANRKHKNGVEWYAYYLIRYLSKIDKKNNYVLYTDRPLENDLTDLTETKFFSAERERPKPINNGQMIKSPHNNFRAEILRWPFHYFWTLGRLSLEMIIKKPDILFIPTSGIPLIRPKKTINTVHDVAFKREANVYERKDLGPQKRMGRKIIDFFVKIFTLGKQGANTADYLNWSTNYAAQNAQKIIAVSRFTKDEIVKLYDCRQEKIEVVYNGFNDLLYKKINNQEAIDAILNKYGLSRPYILYVGRLEKKKDIPLLIAAFARVKHLKNIKEKLILVGDAGFGFDEINQSINGFGLDKEVIMPGWVPEADMPYIFNGATAFIFPSRHEGFGIPVIQAFACGVPAAVSNIPVLREIAGDGALFFNCSDKEKSMARAIERIISDNSLRKKLAEKGLKRAKDFSWERCARETLKIIEELKD